jgi:hypothetical protein
MLGKSSSGRTSSEAPNGAICVVTDVRTRDRRPILHDVRARLGRRSNRPGRIEFELPRFPGRVLTTGPDR